MGKEILTFGNIKRWSQMKLQIFMTKKFLS